MGWMCKSDGKNTWPVFIGKPFGIFPFRRAMKQTGELY